MIHDPVFLAEMTKGVRDKVLAAVRVAVPTVANAALVLKGGTSEDFSFYDTDISKCEFRQEQFFRYLFGLNEPDCYAALELSSGAVSFFVPPVSADMARWNGPAHSAEWYKSRYGIQDCHDVNEVAAVLKAKGITQLYTLMGTNVDSGCCFRTPPDFPGLSDFTVDDRLLFPILEESRVHKTAPEVRLMRACNLVTSQAHLYVMRHVRAGMMEMHLESLFKSWTSYFGGSRELSYTCICGSGPNGSILHYGHAGRPNDRQLEEADMVLLDMGAEYAGYATDVTRSYPVSGKFTPDQAAVFRAVRAAQVAVMGAMRPGVPWPDMHRLAEEVILQHLLDLGVLHHGTVSDLMAAHLGAVFMPHGLGHLMGQAVHDVGGYPKGTVRPATPGPCWLRTARVLEKGMVITVEPGIYFNEPWLEIARQDPGKAKFLNTAVLERFRSFGGVRLEDDVLVTEDGAENLTVLPSSVEEIEAVMEAARKP